MEPSPANKGKSHRRPGQGKVSSKRSLLLERGQYGQVLQKSQDPFERAYANYRLSRSKEGLDELEGRQDLPSRLLRAQLLFRKGEYRACVGAYENVGSEDEDASINRTGAEAALAWSGGTPTTVGEKSATHEQLLNKATGMLARVVDEKDFNVANKALEDAKTAVKVSLEGEALERDLQHITIQQGFAAQRAGNVDEARTVYDSILKDINLRPLEIIDKSRPVLRKPKKLADHHVVALHNWITTNCRSSFRHRVKEGDLDIQGMFEALKQRITFGKLLPYQRVVIGLNEVKLAAWAHSPKQARLALREITQKFGESALSAVTQVAMLTDESEDVVRGVLSRYPDHPGVRFAIAQHFLKHDKPNLARDFLLEYSRDHRDSLRAPGVLSTIVNLLIQMKAYEEAHGILADAAPCREVDHHLARVKLLSGAPESLASYQSLAKADPSDQMAVAGTVLAMQLSSSHALQAIERYAAKYLEDVDDELDALDFSAVEQGAEVLRIRHGRKGKVAPVPTTYRPRVPRKKKTKRKRRPRPRDYDPERVPDPERWLPKSKRSGYTSKKKGRGRQVFRGGHQGAVADDAGSGPPAPAAVSTPAAAVRPRRGRGKRPGRR